jgi:tRNA-uridine 2-sulfurtransferase
LLRDDVVLGDLNWLATPPAPGERLDVRLRHRAPLVPATVEAVTAGEVLLRLERAQLAITPGQSGVLYRGDSVVGGGRIRQERDA